MHYIYLLQSKKITDYIYIGNTDNLKRRLVEHNNGNNYSTKHYAPFRLTYYEAYSSRKDAFDREYKLKHYGSTLGHLKKRLRNSLLNINQKGGV